MYARVHDDIIIIAAAITMSSCTLDICDGTLCQPRC